MRGLQEVNDAVIDSVRAVYPRNDRATCLILLREFEVRGGLSGPSVAVTAAGERPATQTISGQVSYRRSLRCGTPCVAWVWSAF